MILESTIVFEQNWNAIHALDENGERKYKYIINTGSSRSSKTYSIIDCLDLYSRSNGNKRISAWRDTKKDCKDTVMFDFLKRLKTTKRFSRPQFNKTESIYNYNVGSSLWFNGTDDEEKVHGFTQDVAWLNEPYKISKETFDQIDQRTSDFIFIDWNPKKSHWIDVLSKHPRAIVINSTFKDNPFCPKEQKIKIEGYEPINKELVEQKLSKDTYTTIKNTKSKELVLKLIELLTENEQKEILRGWQNTVNETADAYMWDVYGLGRKAEKPNKIYKGWKFISPIEFDKLPYKSYFGLDFGETNPTALIECKYNDGILYFKELIYTPGKQIASLSKQLETLGIEKGTDLIICDSASPDKISELRQSGFYAVGANKGSGSVVAGISFINKLKVFITKGSENLENEYDNYEWELDRYGLPIDSPLKKDDHLMDALRYIANYLKVYLNIKV